jgi:predicted transcriptional regulator
VGELLRESREPAPILTVGSHDEVGRALELMREHAVSQVPVVSSEDERAFIGMVSERGLLWASAEHPGILGEPVTEVLEPPLPELSVDDPAEDAVRLVRDEARAVIVVGNGRPLGILTAVDLVEALNR